jgi:hypothetical protein
MVAIEMEAPLESSISSLEETPNPPRNGWGKWGIVAAVSVVAGGLAAALWYKNAVKSLHRAEEEAKDPNFGIHDSGEEL